MKLIVDNTIIIGIDGGATKVSGWIIEYSLKNGLFHITDINVQKKYSDYPGFNPAYKPVDIKIQLKEMNSELNLTDKEIKQGEIYMAATADVIAELIRNFPDKNAIVGIGMPGLKTKNRRGISALINGPRMPEYCLNIESKLQKENLSLLSPIAHLGSDADYCGLGEEYSEDGLFKDVKNAYYLGGGTGVADAMKLHGGIVPFDHAKTWMAKSWEMKCDKNLSLEKYASSGGIQSVYSSYSNIPVEELNKNEIYPPQILKKALENDKAALATINDIGHYIAELLFERITTIYSGWSDFFTFVNPEKKIQEKNHTFLGTLLDRIVIGQRLGDLLQESKKTPLLWKQIGDYLSVLIKSLNEKEISDHYIKNGKFNMDLIAISKLREAPAIGAGVDAYLNYKYR